MYAGRIISAPAITTIRPLRMSCISVPAIVVLVPVVIAPTASAFLEYVPYIDDSRFRGWKELPGDCHVCGVSYHPGLRSYFSSLCLEFPNKQLHRF